MRNYFHLYEESVKENFMTHTVLSIFYCKVYQDLLLQKKMEKCWLEWQGRHENLSQ